MQVEIRDRLGNVLFSDVSTQHEDRRPWAIGAALVKASRSQAQMRGANLSGVCVPAYSRFERIDLTGSDLSNAWLAFSDLRLVSLDGADLTGALLQDTIGNGREIKTALVEQWLINWTRDSAGKTLLCIGCVSKPMETWESAPERLLAAMDDAGPVWWGRNGDAVLSMVKAFPAVPHGG